MRSVLVLLTALLTALPAPACSFCNAGLQSRQTLREHLAQSAVVVQGKLANPRYNLANDTGSTDIHIDFVHKSDPALAGRKSLTIPRYFPVIGNTPPDFLVFGTVKGGIIDPTHGVPATAAVMDYLKDASRLDAKDTAKLLAFYFPYLDSRDPAIAEDAFTEFARAPDSAIMAAAKSFDPAKLRAMIANPATPVERLGVLAFLLGACGGAENRAFLGDMVTRNPPSEREQAALGGLLAGYILLDPTAGWKVAESILADAKRSYAERLSVIGTVRFFQSTRPKETQENVVRCCAVLLAHGDLADQAIEDMRRWGWWDLTKPILALWGQPSHSAPILKRSLVRYALTCPSAEAKDFIASIRTTNGKLVDSVAESLAAYETIPPR